MAVGREEILMSTSGESELFQVLSLMLAKIIVIKGISTFAFGNILDVSDKFIENQRARTSPIEIIAR